MENPYKQKTRRSMEQIAVLVLAVLGALSILGLVALGFTSTETQFIQNTLGSVVAMTVAAIAGLVRSG